MIYIAHRGNIDGPNPSRENDPDYIDEALKLGYDVEVDVWFDRDLGWWLGHDTPVYNMPEHFLTSSNLWLHCKNAAALHGLVTTHHYHANLNFFWHQDDHYTLTSKQYIWCYPGYDLDGLADKTCAINVLPEYLPENSTSPWADIIIDGFGGICSDYIGRYRS
jgi:hypothetical protein